MTFQEIIESYGKQISASFTLNNTNLQEEISAEQILSVNPHFDGALYTSVMRCLDVVLLGDCRDKTQGAALSDFSITAAVNGESKTINYGTFFVAEAPEYDEEADTTILICYDAMYRTMKPYALKLEFPCSLEDYLRAVLKACGLECANISELKNKDMKVLKEQFLNVANDEDEEGTTAYKYRDVLDDIARSAGCSFAFKSDANGDSVDELYVIYVTDGSGNMKEPVATLDVSNFKKLTVGEKYGPANTVVFSRQPQEDNVYLKADNVTDETASEVKLTQPLTAEGTDEERAKWLPEILAAVKGTEYQCYSFDSYGIAFLNFGDVFTIRSYKRDGKRLDLTQMQEYQTVFMRTDMMIDGDIKESSKLEMPVATSTDYNAAATPGEKKLFQAYMKVDKQLGEITAVVSGENGLVTKVGQNENSIKAQAESIKKINEAGYITQATATSLIETKITEEMPNLTLSVAKSIQVGARNIFFNSACFENITVGFHKAEAVKSGENVTDITKDVTGVPSGRARSLMFSCTDDSTVSGITFPCNQTLGEESGKITKVTSGKTYTLSFFAGAVADLELSYQNLIFAGEGVNVKYLSVPEDLTLTATLKRFVFTFELSGNPTNFLIRFFAKCEKDRNYAITFSSLKLEEGNIATDWTPNVGDIEQSVDAKLELCVKTDENGNLVSAIHASANQITIETDNFKLEADGTMTCHNATITSGAVNDTVYEGIKIKDGKVYFIVDDTAVANLSGGGLHDLLITASDKNSIGIFSDEVDFYGGTSSSATTVNVNGVLNVDEVYSDVIKTPNLKVMTANETKERINIYCGEYTVANDTAVRDIILSAGGLVISANEGKNGLYLIGSKIYIRNPAEFNSTATFNSTVKLGNNISITSADTNDPKTLKFNVITEFNAPPNFAYGATFRQGAYFNGVYLNNCKGIDYYDGEADNNGEKVKYVWLAANTESGEIVYIKRS